MIAIKAVRASEILNSEALIAEYAAECSIPAIGKINPQGDIYAVLEQSGIMRCFMAYDGEQKIGFATMLMAVLPHYGKRIATLESLFIAKAHRSSSAGRELMRTVEAEAASSGCEGILYSSPAGGQLERLLEASKPYQRTNAVFFRRLS